MILYQPFEAEHFEKLELQPDQASLKEYVTYEMLKALETKDAYTFTADGVPIAICGLVRMWPGRAIMWCFLSTMSISNKLSLTRMVKRYIEYIDVDRLEINVDINSKGAHQWARMLGFKCEAPLLKKFHFNGTDSSLYAKVRE